MAFSETNFFTVLGKYVKAVNAMETLISTYGATKTDLAAIMNSENYLDYYDSVPDLVEAIQDGVTAWINSEITDSKNIFLNRTKVFEELELTKYTFNDVLLAVHKYMTDNSKTILESAVLLNGSAGSTQAQLSPNGTSADLGTAPRVFLSTQMSGLQSPSNGFSADVSYNNVPSQLVIPADLFFRCTSAPSIGSEVIQVYSGNKRQSPYTRVQEEPGTGPSLANVHNQSLVSSNWDFSSFTNDDPTGWTLSGGVSGTDWEKGGSTPTYLTVKSTAVKVKQQITGLQANNMYMIGVYWIQTTSSGNPELTIKLEETDGTVLNATYSTVTDNRPIADVNYYATFFYAPTELQALSDIYLSITSNFSDASHEADIYKVMVTPVTYYNGIAMVAWSGGTHNNAATTADVAKFLVDDFRTFAVTNDNAGKFQTFFRKAYKHQLPTASSPSVADSLAT